MEDTSLRIASFSSDRLDTTRDFKYPHNQNRDRGGQPAVLTMNELEKTKTPVQLINSTNEWRLVQGDETAQLRVKRDIEDDSSKLDAGC
ncbi:hypothetical protein TNCV_2986001 [Trichonephila clavipes]|nr:hypothetical protein TNCV_2986001 [Trichonephila clavipes]